MKYATSISRRNLERKNGREAILKTKRDGFTRVITRNTSTENLIFRNGMRYGVSSFFSTSNFPMEFETSTKNAPIAEKTTPSIFTMVSQKPPKGLCVHKSYLGASPGGIPAFKTGKAGAGADHHPPAFLAKDFT